MFQSTMLRRTMTLVFTALFASTLLTVIAFVLAGRNATIDMEVDNILNQNRDTGKYLSQHPELLNDEYFVEYFFNMSLGSLKDYYIYDTNGDVIYGTSAEQRTVNNENYDLGINYLRESIFPEVNDTVIYYQTLDTNSKDNKLLITLQPITFPDSTIYLVSFSYISEYNDIISSSVNILMLSTLIAAFVMIIPAYIMVRRIVLPIQEINEIAMEYGRGNFSIRANESHKGEIGELGQSFNFLADRLSKSINDITIERNRLEDIFNVISDGILVVDENSNKIMSNNQLNIIFSKAKKTNMFTERLQIIPFDEVWEAIDNCIAEHEAKECTVEGPEYAIQCTIIPKFDIKDESICVGATGFFRDIFDEQKLERTRRDYVANISHELRTPLQTLRGLIEPLSDGMVKKEEDKQRYYNIILNETMRLSRLIDDMLELSKLQSRTLAFKTFPFDLNQLLSELETKFRPVMHDAGITFKVRFDSGRLPTVMGNPDRVEQVLVILLDNAKKYTPSGKTITIYSDYIESEGKVYISVADTGQGIHEYDIGHIFDRFFKADRARGKKGTGLGLSIAKELLTYMGEDITVKSVYGEGTTFTFTLSKAEATNAWY